MGVRRLALLAALVLAAAAAPTAGAAACDTSYPTGRFRACYFAGTDPATGAYLGSEDEAPLADPVPARGFGINHDWGFGPVFGGIAPGQGGDISGVWRGRLRFPGGRYQVVLFTADGARLYVDERLVIDEWSLQEERRYGASLDLAPGYHRIRVEWFGAGLTPWTTVLRLHWDRVATAASPKASRAVIDVFLLRQQRHCIVGDPWTDGPAVRVYNPDYTVERAWQVDEARGLPRSLPASDPSVSSYPQVECFTFGFEPEELLAALAQVDEYAATVKAWTHGAIDPVLRLHALAGELPLSRIGVGWWVGPWNIAAAAQPLLTKETDFVLVLNAMRDVGTGRFVDLFGCGGT